MSDIQTSSTFREISVQAIPTPSGHEYRLKAVEVRLGIDGKPESIVELPAPHALAHLGDFMTRLAVGSAEEQVAEQKSAILVPGRAW